MYWPIHGLFFDKISLNVHFVLDKKKKISNLIAKFVISDTRN